MKESNPALEGAKLKKYILHQLAKHKQLRSDTFTGADYYNGRMEIDKKLRLGADDKGETFVLKGLPNTIVKDNQYARLVDQKVNYIFSLPPIVESDNENYAQAIIDFFDKRFLRTLAKIAREAYNEGIGWLFLYPDGKELKYKKVNAKDIIPIWADENHESLQALIRLRAENEFLIDGAEAKEVQRRYVEWYTKDGVKTFSMAKNGDLDFMEHLPYTSVHGMPLNWQDIPFIYWRYRDGEKSLLDRVKPLQDTLNTMLSNYGDNMLEDARNSLLVLKGYDGEDPVSARREINATGVIQLHPDGGDVSTLESGVNTEAYELIIRTLKEKIIENGRGVDAKNERGGQAPNQLNIKSMYSDIELDANGTELEFQASFEHFQKFFRAVYGFSDDDVATISFRRNMMINDESTVQMIRDSYNILSTQTLIENHPFIDNPLKELERLKEEAETDYEGAFYDDEVAEQNEQE